MQQFHVVPQGVQHAMTPEAGAYDGQRPMLIMTTYTKPPGANDQWPGPTPQANTSAGWRPPHPHNQSGGDYPFIPSPLHQYWST